MSISRGRAVDWSDEPPTFTCPECDRSGLTAEELDNHNCEPEAE